MAKGWLKATRSKWPDRSEPSTVSTSPRRRLRRGGLVLWQGDPSPACQNW